MSMMRREAREAAEAAARFLGSNSAPLAALAQQLRNNPPTVILTAARGSSDHAATYFKYIVEIMLGVPCASIGASVASVWHSELRLKSAVCVTISQSGQSPDIVGLQAAARKAGAVTVAMVNQPDSRAGQDADFLLPLCAGPEKSVPATKSFIVSLVAGAAIAAHWKQDLDLGKALEALPQKLQRAAEIQWPLFQARARSARSLYVLGRGPGLAIAQEAALKMKETCAIHAEALSFAEVMHGPLELVAPRFPILAFAPDDAARELNMQALIRLRKTGADVFAVEDGGLDYESAGHALLEPISMIQSAYLNIEQIARGLGRDPDAPRLLSKVTETL